MATTVGLDIERGGACRPEPKGDAPKKAAKPKAAPNGPERGHEGGAEGEGGTAEGEVPR